MASTLEIETPVNRKRKEHIGWRRLVRKTGFFILFLACAIAVFVFGSNYYSIFPTNKNLLYEASLAAVFLIAAIWLRWKSSFQPYWQIAYAFFVADCVILVTSLTAGYRDILFNKISIVSNTSQGIAESKVFEALLTIGTILLLSRLAGIRLESLYVKQGRLKWGIIIGFGVLINFASSSLMFFAGRFTSLENMGAALLWGLVFSIANGFMEELWLRGQFLRKLEPVLGPGISIGLTSIWFALFHIGAVYMTPAAIPFYLANLFTFGVAWGYAMHKTDSWIAPGLMHAASDFFLFIAMLSPA